MIDTYKVADYNAPNAGLAMTSSAVPRSAMLPSASSKSGGDNSTSACATWRSKEERAAVAMDLFSARVTHAFASVGV